MERIQLSRRKGWKMPEGARKVDRSTAWGNPYPVAEYGDNALPLYRQLIERMSPATRRAWLAPLRGFTALACWCKEGADCHADILIEWIAKEFADEQRTVDQRHIR